MMKTYQKFVAGGLIVALSAGVTFAYATNRVDAGVGDAVTVGIRPEAKISVTKTQSALGMTKKEVVYVFTGADGKENKVVVTDTLTNPDALTSLSDITNLQDIVNVKGNESFTQSGSDIVWQANGSDITYRGVSQETVPVGVKVTYFLDGKEIPAQELVGKSGKVTIRFDYYNNRTEKVNVGGKEEEIVVPFAMATAVLLDEEKFANIEVTHGRLLHEGNLCAAVLVGMPGVAESLGLSEDFSADYAEITADMVDFSLTNTFTVATNSLFADISLDDEVNLDSLSDALTKLGDATDELVDGTLKLKDGAGALCDGATDLAEGAKKLKDGAGTLSDGAGTLSDNILVLADGAKSLQDGAKTLKDGIGSFAAGLDNAKSGSEALADGANSLKSGAEEFADGVDAASQGVGALAAGSKELAGGADQVKEGAAGLNAGIGQLSAGLKDLDAGVDTAYASLAATISYNQQVLDGLTGFAAAYGAGLDAETLASLKTMIGTLQQTIAAQQQIADSMTGTGALKSGVKALADGTASLSTGAQALVDGAGTLSDGAKALDAGIGELAEKLPQLTEGFSALEDGIRQVESGAAELDTGLAQLKTASGQLSAGAGSLYDGSTTLSEGADALAQGSVTLKDGAAELANGTNDLADGANKLLDGAKELADGTVTLADGMDEYSREGIGKLLDALDDADLTTVYEKLGAMVDAAAQYKSFTGVNDEMDASVTFIIRTESVEK